MGKGGGNPGASRSNENSRARHRNLSDRRQTLVSVLRLSELLLVIPLIGRVLGLLCAPNAAGDGLVSLLSRPQDWSETHEERVRQRSGRSGEKSREEERGGSSLVKWRDAATMVTFGPFV